MITDAAKALEGHWNIDWVTNNRETIRQALRLLDLVQSGQVKALRREASEDQITGCYNAFLVDVTLTECEEALRGAWDAAKPIGESQ